MIHAARGAVEYMRPGAARARYVLLIVYVERRMYTRQARATFCGVIARVLFMYDVACALMRRICSITCSARVISVNTRRVNSQHQSAAAFMRAYTELRVAAALACRSSAAARRCASSISACRYFIAIAATAAADAMPPIRRLRCLMMPFILRGSR